MERPEFCPSREDVEQAFWQIVNPIICSNTAKLEALSLFDEGVFNGDPKKEVEAIKYTIGASDWHWPWFEEWRFKFEQMGRWPYMWQELIQNKPVPDTPTTIEQASEILSVNQMRDLLKAAGEMKLPRTREEIAARFVTTIAFDAARHEIESRLQAERLEYARRRNRILCELLANTVMSLVYSTRRQREIIESLHQDPTYWQVQLTSAGCPVEDEIAAGVVMDLFLGAIPPYFPGDRTRLRLKRVRSDK